MELAQTRLRQLVFHGFLQLSLQSVLISDDHVKSPRSSLIDPLLELILDDHVKLLQLYTAKADLFLIILRYTSSGSPRESPCVFHPKYFLPRREKLSRLFNDGSGE